MNILFISLNNFKDINYGGGQCSKRNFSVLQQVGNVDYKIICKKNNRESIISILQGKFPPITKEDEEYIKKNLDKYSIVFLDSSLLGHLAKCIKKINKRIFIISFCHNVEYDYIDVRMNKGIKNFIYKKLAKRHERLSLLYADKIIALNNRDSNRLKFLYNREADCILPISFTDNYHGVNDRCELPEKPIGIFVGAFGRANYEGVKWFVQNSKSLNHINFQIIGKGFENVKSELEQYECNVIGTVDNLEKYYENAEFVISPILFGGGMKVKIAEALMYGKTVFGTREALEGYEDEKGNSLYECNNIREFDTQISNWLNNNRNRFNKNSRELYLKKYSTDIIEAQFKNLISGK